MASPVNSKDYWDDVDTITRELDLISKNPLWDPAGPMTIYELSTRGWAVLPIFRQQSHIETTKSCLQNCIDDDGPVQDGEEVLGSAIVRIIHALMHRFLVAHLFKGCWMAIFPGEIYVGTSTKHWTKYHNTQSDVATTYKAWLNLSPDFDEYFLVRDEHGVRRSVILPSGHMAVADDRLAYLPFCPRKDPGHLRPTIDVIASQHEFAVDVQTTSETLNSGCVQSEPSIYEIHRY